MAPCGAAISLPAAVAVRVIAAVNRAVTCCICTFGIYSCIVHRQPQLVEARLRSFRSGDAAASLEKTETSPTQRCSDGGTRQPAGRWNLWQCARGRLRSSSHVESACSSQREHSSGGSR